MRDGVFGGFKLPKVDDKEPAAFDAAAFTAVFIQLILPVWLHKDADGVFCIMPESFAWWYKSMSICCCCCCCWGDCW